MTAEWAVFIGMVAGFVALATLTQRVISQLMARMDASDATAIERDRALAQETEKRRREDAEIWMERLHARDEAIARLGGRLDAAIGEHHELHMAIATVKAALDEHRAKTADTYVTRETLMEMIGAISVRLEKGFDRLATTRGGM